MAYTPRWSRFPRCRPRRRFLGALAPAHSYGVVRRLCGCVDAQGARCRPTFRITCSLPIPPLVAAGRATERSRPVRDQER